MIQSANLILYVANQDEATAFYTAVLAMEPTLHVPGMSEFRLSQACVLGLMPVAGLRRLLPDLPSRSPGELRAELYLYVDDPASYHRRSLEQGARELSSLQPRDWGDRAAYSLDPDGHVLAFAARGRPSDG